MIGVPVRCPQCGQYTFVIRPGDKFFCTNSTCTHAGRLSTDMTTSTNLNMQRYYIMELEQLACKVLGLDYFELRRDGTLKHVTNESTKEVHHPCLSCVWAGIFAGMLLVMSMYYMSMK